MRLAAVIAVAVVAQAVAAAPPGPGAARPATPPASGDAADSAFRGLSLSRARTLLPGFDDCGDVVCLIERAYAADPRARQLALAMWNERGDLAGVGPDEIMDGGYRGKIHLVPQLPIGAHRKHLQWVAEAMRSIDEFFRAAFADRPAPRYRWRGLAFRFVRSVGKRTPSAYAIGWAVERSETGGGDPDGSAGGAGGGAPRGIEYNVAGSLLTSAAGVREMLIHELFHDNDEDHGDWSARRFQADYAAILARCGRRPAVACLAPYAPNTTMVRGGTFYAFQQDNGNAVHEYAAELAVRYFREQGEMLAAGKLAGRAFKCGPAENARAWQALVDEFFAGRDLVPACS
ncbi:MAG TPA: hypothetical protein VHT91_23120 [Kofleriaceae bacterium]|jgi:hypothetical protein|nr:hypothetical protein [Kofleriaceae bacterium]